MSFRSLLQGFQAATGTPSPPIIANNSNSSIVKTSTNRHTDPKTALLEWTTNIWNQTRIRQAMAHPTQHCHRSEKNPFNDSAATKTATSRIHLAVCICIVDNLPHENIWRRWIQDGNTATTTTSSNQQPTVVVTASVYIHAKHPEKIRENGSPWLQQCLIPVSHQPNWNDVRIVRAMLSLVEHALDQHEQPPSQDHDGNSTASNGPITHILFATESCMPITPINELQSVLLMRDGETLRQGEPCSFLDYYGRNEATRFEEHQCWNIVSQYLPMDCIHKALPGWCLLTAQHAKEVLHLSYPHRNPTTPLSSSSSSSISTLPPSIPELDLTLAFEECWAPEEVYFATALCLLGHIRPSHEDDDSNSSRSDSVRRQSVVHAEWPPNRCENERAHPKFWDDDFSEQLIANLRQSYHNSNYTNGRLSSSSSSSRSPILFLRKVKYHMPIKKWEKAVFGTKSFHSTTKDRPASPPKHRPSSMYRNERQAYDTFVDSDRPRRFQQQEQQQQRWQQGSSRSVSPGRTHHNNHRKRSWHDDSRHSNNYDRDHHDDRGSTRRRRHSSPQQQRQRHNYY